MTSTQSRKSLLLVHAHPDDETINNGATMAMYVAAGYNVTLVTCTRGEEGEILVPELAHLAADKEDGLAPIREAELANAMAALGVTDHRFLGAPAHRYRDSGMMDTPPNNRPDVFWQADIDAAARELVEIIKDVKPQVLVTYDEIGGYGHPDHIQAHRVAMRAADLAMPDWNIQKIYWNTMPRSVIQKSIDAMKAQGSDFMGVDSADELPFAKPDEVVTTHIDGAAFVDQKMKAMASHPTQIALDGPFFALSNNIGLNVWGNEYYTLVKGEKAGSLTSEGWEADLFAGVTE
jgi:N-acetyl-1-D-myo-inositol-2-amino-2-deoxy-alpha-D-glucopyranoside deacetylase